jgi:hypothetical protein
MAETQRGPNAGLWESRGAARRVMSLSHRASGISLLPGSMHACTIFLALACLASADGLYCEAKPHTALFI